MPNSPNVGGYGGDGAAAQNKASGGAQIVSAPAISLPKGGGAIKGIGEKFAANPVTGTGSLTIPIATSASRSGFGPQLSLSYDSGAGNGLFGLGWNLGLPSITRKTDKGIPQYRDAEQSDDFILSGAEDLVPVLIDSGVGWTEDVIPSRLLDGQTYRIQRYRPRIEGLFARIERWSNHDDAADVFWRSISKDNITTWYGKNGDSRIFDSKDSSRIFSWMVCESYDAKGNAIVYEYKRENSDGLNLSQAHERNRTVETRSVNRHLKRIKYGNRTPYFPILDEVQPEPSLPAEWLFQVVFDYGEHDADNPLPADTLIWPFRNDPFSSYRAGFEVRTYRLCQRVLMFHNFPDEEGVGADCLVRSTDFTYSFETNPANTRNPVLSFMDSVTQSGYKRDGISYIKKSHPPVEFEYTMPEVQSQVRDIDHESLENLPSGLNEHYRWVDLDGEGLSGILTEQGRGWFYKPNLSPITTQEESGELTVVAAFGPLEQLSLKPSLAQLSGGGQQFIDLAGDGQLDLVDLQGPAPGFYERTTDDEWEPFRTFDALPNLDWRNPNLKFIDLTGDGHADIMVSEHEAFTWYPSLSEDGFGPSEKVSQAIDEEKGPRLIFADGANSIYLADMSGDGLNDLLRIRNREVCYWPNLGYGRFGTKVTMDNAPLFDTPDQFDLKRIRVADIDGSGVADIIYLKRDGVHIYFNQSGNSWGLRQKLAASPHVDDLSQVDALDLLGNGTACLVWSSALPTDAQRSMRYIDLMGGQKPHLLRRSVNNLGAETVVSYAPSTRFYLADKLMGKPWLTRIPFPVQVVERVETYDRISRNRFVTRYAYHHGYFDGVEREFRGFGMVDQWDTETLAALTTTGELPTGNNLAETSYVPPVHTKSWFHNGAYLSRDHISDFFAGSLDEADRGEYYREPAWRDDDVEARQHLLPDTTMPAGLTLEEERAACRALKGSMLRQEIYAEDGTANAEHPYTVTEQNFSIKLLQPCEDNRHAVFFTHPCESISYHYERNPIDPRIAHTLKLEVDEFGNTLRSMTVGYPRAAVAERQPEQNEEHIVFTLSRFATRDDQPDWRHIGLPVETRTYELVKPPAATLRLAWQDMRDLTAALVPLNQIEPALAMTIPYEQWDWRKTWNPVTEPGGLVNTRLRLIEHVRTRYRPDDLGAALNDPLALLPPGTVESLALAGESYKLAFTSSLLTSVYQRPLSVVQPPGSPAPENLLPTPAIVLGGGGPDRGGYVDLDNNGNWWIPSGRAFFSPGAGDVPGVELAHARSHFFQLHRYRDPFHTNAVHTETLVTYDPYDLIVLETQDAVGNRVTAGERDSAGNLISRGIDYRVLQPRLVMDPNRNRTSVAFDIRGLLVGTAVMGKPLQAPVEGDSLDGLDADPAEAVIIAQLSNPLADPTAILQQATTRIIYDMFAFYRTRDQAIPAPPVVCILARETHDNVPPPNGGVRIQHTFSYSDGFGRVIQKKVRAESGSVPTRDLSNRIIVGPDGQPVMSINDVSPRWVGTGWTVFNNKGKPVRQYEPFFTDTHLFDFDVRIGVSPILLYDPVERVVAMVHPNHSWEKVVFDPWRQETWDVNDTMLVADPRLDSDVGDFFNRLQASDYLPTWQAQRVTGALGADEQAAAGKAASHAGTPTVAHTDSLGRTFLTVAHNVFKYSDAPLADPPVEQFHETRVLLDVEGNQREIVDANLRAAMRYAYDMLSNRIQQANMEAGERWTLSDVAGKTLLAWDSRNQRCRMTYDAQRRPTDKFVQSGVGAEVLVGRTVYGESEVNAETANLRTKVVRCFDQAGQITNQQFDFKGNLLRSQRQLAREYKATLDWSVAVPLEADIYSREASYDALDRLTTIIAPDASVIRPGYNDANLLEKLDVNLRGEQLNGQPVWTSFVADIDYDAKGQRQEIHYGNGTSTLYTYDRFTFRLTQLLTQRDALAFPDDCPDPFPLGWPGCQIQNLHYTYDPAANITRIRDDAQQTLYFRNKRVEPSAEYTYDAKYRLIEATGREHLGQVAAAPAPHSYNDRPRVGIAFSSSDGNAVGRYLERYVYDPVGNLSQMIHRGSDPVNPGWTRSYSYNEPSLLGPGEQSNRLTSTTIGTTTETYSVGGNGFDSHGNMLSMPHLQVLQWDFKDQLQMTQRQAVNPGDEDGVARQGERTWYVYDHEGRRVRKVTELASGQLKDERIYLEGFEVYRRPGVNAVVRETLHIMDEKQRIALVETRTQGTEAGVPARLIRYQLGNQLGSVTLELDDQAQIISYEEYTPFGATSFQAVRSQLETPKRYRYTGKERDEESGFYYHGARYYAPWLARWISADPANLKVLSESQHRSTSSEQEPSRSTPEEGAEGNGLTNPVSSNAGMRDETDEEAARGNVLERPTELLNLYQYVALDPISRKDPDGRTPVPVPLTTTRLRAIARAQGIGAGLTGIQFNRAVGIAFETFVQSSLGQIPRNTASYYSPARALRTGGLPASVIPEYVTSVDRITWRWGFWPTVTTFRESSFYEVKAVAGTLTLSSSRHQIRGLVDVASRSPAALATGPNRPVPILTFVTTGDTVIGADVLAEATRQGVAIWQAVVFEIDNIGSSNPTLDVGPLVPLNPQVYGPTGIPVPIYKSVGTGTLTNPPLPIVPIIVPNDPDPTEVQ